MYLTKINMDLRNRSVQQGFRDCTDMHRNIQKYLIQAGLIHTYYIDLYRKEIIRPLILCPPCQ